MLLWLLQDQLQHESDACALGIQKFELVADVLEAQPQLCVLKGITGCLPNLGLPATRVLASRRDPAECVGCTNWPRQGCVRLSPLACDILVHEKLSRGLMGRRAAPKHKSIGRGHQCLDAMMTSRLSDHIDP